MDSVSDTSLGQLATVIIAILVIFGTVAFALIYPGRPLPAPLAAIDGAVVGLFFGQHTAIRAIEAEHAAAQQTMATLANRQIRATDVRQASVPPPVLPVGDR